MTKQISPNLLRLGVSQSWITPSFFNEIQITKEVNIIFELLTNWLRLNGFYVLNANYCRSKTETLLFFFQIYFYKRYAKKLRRRRNLVKSLPFSIYFQKRKLVISQFRMSRLLYIRFIQRFERKYYVDKRLSHVSSFWENRRVRLKFYRFVLPRLRFFIHNKKQKKSRWLIKQKQLKTYLLLYIYWLRFYHILRYFLYQYIQRPVFMCLSNPFVLINVKKYISKRKQTASLITNLINITYFDLNRYKKYAFFRYSIIDSIIMSWYKSSYAISQWFYFGLTRVKKNREIRHNTILQLYYDLLQHTCTFLNFLNGFRLEVRGKISGSLRSRCRVLKFGQQPHCQQITARFNYSFIAIPTYTGLLGLKIWLL